MSPQLTVPTADTHLHAIDSPGGSPPLVFVNGGFGTTQNWAPVLRLLGDRHRTIRYDARARGKSGTSADYSVAGAVDDIGRVIASTGVERPILVAWSHGATTAVRFAARHPQQVAALVLIDGAYPIAMFDEAGRAKVREQFRKLAWAMRIMAAIGRSARMSAAEAAEVVIEMDAVNGALEPDLASLQCPTVYVVGTGKHPGATEEEMRTLRAAVTVAEASNPQVSVYATVPANHTQILSKSPRTVVGAIEDVVRRS